MTESQSFTTPIVDSAKALIYDDSSVVKSITVPISIS